MKPRASIRLCTVGGVPVYLHATLPLGLALVSGLSFQPLAWLALVIIVLVHEAGHAVLLRRYRLPVIHVVLHGFGGECETVDWVTPWQRAVVAWGGVIAQALLFVAIAFSQSAGLLPPGSLSSNFFSTLTATNVLLALFNLLPLRGLDGNQAWRLVWLSFLRGRHLWLGRRLRQVRASTAKANRDRFN